jgi:hypothetical protein
MNAEEKADSLINSFYQPITLNLNVNNNSKQLWEHAKQCALISIDREIASVRSVIGDQEYMWTSSEKEIINELQQIKSIIENK